LAKSKTQIVLLGTSSQASQLHWYLCTL
jgi:hypothetical protein